MIRLWEIMGILWWFHNVFFSFGQIMIGRRSWEYYETIWNYDIYYNQNIWEDSGEITGDHLLMLYYIPLMMSIFNHLHSLGTSWEYQLQCMEMSKRTRNRQLFGSLKMGWCTDAPPKADPHLHQQLIRLCLEGGPALGYVPVMYGESTGPLVFRANDVTALNVAWQFFLNGLNYSCSARGAIGLEDQDLGRSKDRTWTVEEKNDMDHNMTTWVCLKIVYP